METFTKLETYAWECLGLSDDAASATTSHAMLEYLDNWRWDTDGRKDDDDVSNMDMALMVDYVASRILEEHNTQAESVTIYNQLKAMTAN